MHRHKTLLALLALFALGTAPLAALAQPAQKIPVVGFMHPAGPTAPTVVLATTLIRDGLRELGFVEGKNYTIESRFALGKPDALPGLAQELVRAKVDVLLPIGPAAVMAAKIAAGNLPIVAMDLETNPIASGLIANFARPGGNLTGVFLDLPALTGKWLQLIREIIPGARRIAVLWDANTGESQIRAIKAAAKEMSLDVQILEFRGAAAIEPALNAALKQRPQALVLLGSPLINGASKSIAEFTAKHRIPAISPFRSFPDNGGLISYGVNLPILYGRMGSYVGRVLRGAKPGELAVEQPSHYEMVINQKTAKALGITFPQMVLLRGDETVQ